MKPNENGVSPTASKYKTLHLLLFVSLGQCRMLKLKCKLYNYKLYASPCDVFLFVEEYYVVNILMFWLSWFSYWI